MLGCKEIQGKGKHESVIIGHVICSCEPNYNNKGNNIIQACKNYNLKILQRFKP